MTTPTLPRRPFLGLGVRQEGAGLRVTRVVGGSTAALAALREGDLLIAVDGAPVEDASQVSAALARGQAALAWERDGARHEATVRPVPFPPERLAGAEVEYGEVVVRGARWRTILTRPARPGPHPALLYLAGIGWSSLDHALRPDVPLARFFATLAPDVITLRLERGAIGDGEGPVGSALDFEHEREGYRVALARLREEAPRPFLFGHSLGGVHAPLLDGVAGRVVYGTSAERWSSCLAEGARRQMRLRGRGAVAEDEARRAAAFDTPELRARPPSFHAQLEALDLEAAWRRAHDPALVLIGEHDWVVGEAEQRRVAELAPRAEARLLPGVDHAFTKHGSLEASLRRFGAGDPADEVGEATRTWILARSVR